MQIIMHTGGIAATNCYVVADETAKTAVLFDAPDHTVEPLLQEVKRRGWNLAGLWLTHGHFDHIADHEVVTRHFPAAHVLMHANDEPKLKNPKAQMFILPFAIPPRAADAHVVDGQVLTVGEVAFRVIHTPGHAPGHVMYHCESERLLIGGDLIFAGSVGRSDLPDSDPVVLDESVRKVMQLPDDTRLLCGHGPATTLGDERSSNAFVRMALRARK